MPKASRTKLRKHAPAAQLPSKRSFAVNEPSEVMLPGEESIEVDEDASHPVFSQPEASSSRKKGIILPEETPGPLSSHPYSRSHLRREKRKTKEKLHGGDMMSIFDSLPEESNVESVSLAQHAKRKRRRHKDGDVDLEDNEMKSRARLIGEGAKRTMGEKQRRKQIALEGMRLPLIAKHPEFKRNPWMTIRAHAGETLEARQTESQGK